MSFATPLIWKRKAQYQLSGKSLIYSNYTEQLLSLIKSDPYGFIYQDEEQLSEKSKKLRDERWKCIKSIASQEPDIYESDKRGRLIREAI